MMLMFESWEECPAPGQRLSQKTGRVLGAINNSGDSAESLSRLDRDKSWKCVKQNGKEAFIISLFKCTGV